MAPEGSGLRNAHPLWGEELPGLGEPSQTADLPSPAGLNQAASSKIEADLLIHADERNPPNCAETFHTGNHGNRLSRPCQLYSFMRLFSNLTEDIWIRLNLMIWNHRVAEGSS